MALFLVFCAITQETINSLYDTVLHCTALYCTVTLLQRDDQIAVTHSKYMCPKSRVNPGTSPYVLGSAH